MNKKLWAGVVFTLCLLSFIGFSLPWWMPKAVTHYTSKTAFPVQISSAGWSTEGLQIKSLQLSTPSLELLMEDIILSWHDWHFGPQFGLIIGPSSITLKDLKQPYPTSVEPTRANSIKPLDLAPIAGLLSRVPFIEMPNLKISMNDGNPIWAFIALSSSEAVNAANTNNTRIQLVLLPQPPDQTSLKSLKQLQVRKNGPLSLEKPLPVLSLGSLTFNADTRSWSMDNRLFLSSTHHWLMSAPTKVKAKLHPLLEQLTAIDGTASIKLNGQLQGQRLVIVPLQGKLELESSLELATPLDKTALLDETAADNAHNPQTMHTQHQLKLSWPFEVDTDWHTGPIHISLLGQRRTLTATELDELWPNVWSLDLNIPKLSGQDTQLLGSASIDAQVSGKYWESHLNLQVAKLLCETIQIQQTAFLASLHNLDNLNNLNCQLSFQTHLTSESQHPNLMGTARSQLDGDLSLQQNRLSLLLNQATIKAQDISYPQGSTKQIAITAAPLEIKSGVINSGPPDNNQTDSSQANNSQANNSQPSIELSGRLNSVVQQAIYQPQQAKPRQQAKQQTGINPRTTAAPSEPIALSATLNLEISPQRRSQPPSDASTPLQHDLSILFNLLDALTFEGGADITLPQPKQSAVSLNNLVLEQQPMSASELQQLLAKLNQLPQGIQLTTGSLRTKVVAQDLLDAKAPIELSVNMDDVSIQQEQQSLQGLTANLLLRGSQTQLLSQGINQNSFHIKRINSGIPLDDLKANLFMEVHSNAKQPFQLTLNQIGLKALGGTASIDKLQVWPLNQSSGVLELNNLDLAQLVTLQSQPGISASGRLQGRLPFGFDSSGALFIKQGTLAATPAGGYISVKDNPSAEAFKSGNPQLKQAFEALEYLQFKTLTSETSMSATGDLIFKARVEGKNPQQQNNRPIVFNYTHEENLYLLLKSLLIGEQMAKELENTVGNKVNQ